MEATVTDIVGRFSREFGLLVTLTLAVGTPAAYVAMDRWLQTFAHRVEIGPAIFVGTAACALLVAGLAIGTHAARATRTDPATTLRNE